MVSPNSLANRQKNVNDDRQMIIETEGDDGGMVTVDLNRIESSSDTAASSHRTIRSRNKYLFRLMLAFCAIIVILISFDMVNEKYHLIYKQYPLYNTTAQENKFNEKILKGNYIEQYLHDMKLCKIKQTMEYCCHIFRNSGLNDLIEFCTVSTVLDSLVAYEQSPSRKKRAATNFAIYYNDDKAPSNIQYLDPRVKVDDPQYYQHHPVPINLKNHHFQTNIQPNIPEGNTAAQWNDQPVSSNVNRHQPQQIVEQEGIVHNKQPNDVTTPMKLQQHTLEHNGFVISNMQPVSSDTNQNQFQTNIPEGRVGYGYKSDGTLIRILYPTQSESIPIVGHTHANFDQPQADQVISNLEDSNKRLQPLTTQPDYEAEPDLKPELTRKESADDLTTMSDIPLPSFRRNDEEHISTEQTNSTIRTSHSLSGNLTLKSDIPSTNRMKLKTLDQYNRDQFIYEKPFKPVDFNKQANLALNSGNPEPKKKLRINLFKHLNDSNIYNSHTNDNDTDDDSLDIFDKSFFSEFYTSTSKPPIIIKPLDNTEATVTEKLPAQPDTKAPVDFDASQIDRQQNVSFHHPEPIFEDVGDHEPIVERINDNINWSAKVYLKPVEIIIPNRIDNFGEEVSTRVFDFPNEETTPNPTDPHAHKADTTNMNSSPQGLSTAAPPSDSINSKLNSSVMNSDQNNPFADSIKKDQVFQSYSKQETTSLAPSQNNDSQSISVVVTEQIHYVTPTYSTGTSTPDLSIKASKTNFEDRRANPENEPEIVVKSRISSSNDHSNEPCFYSNFPQPSSSSFSHYSIPQTRLNIVNPPVFMSSFMHPYPGFYIHQGPVVPPFVSNIYNPAIRASSHSDCLPVPPLAHAMLGVSISKEKGSDSNLQCLIEDLPVDTKNKSRSSQSTLSCAESEVACLDNSKCIKVKHFCDGEVHCSDSSDETACSCSDRIMEFRNCDGYCDCPNCEDEQGCFGCGKNEFSCDDWSRFHKSTCIPMNQRCDNIKQCEITGKDEMDCTILTDRLGNFPQNKISNSVGFLHRNYKGKWYPTCFGTELWAMQVCQVEAGPSSILPKSHMTLTNNIYDGHFINILPNNEISLVNTCVEDRAAFVECPSIYCGIRFLMDNPYRSQELDTSVEDMMSQFERRQWMRNTDEDEREEEPVRSSAEMKIEDQEPSGNDSEIVKESRVVGGRASQPAAWPWLVSIYRNGIFYCGGVLIHESWVMTASHCVDRYWNYYYEIQAGILRRFSYSPMDQRRYAKMIISNELYEEFVLRHDIALIKLSHPMRFNRYVRPICLPSEATAGVDFLKGPKPGTVCTTVGWGATLEHGPDPDQMREVEVPILEHCKNKEDFDSFEICAGFAEGGKDACQGDSGGPLMCRNPNNPNQWYLAGIVSHGEGCARPNEPGVYTKVSHYLGWINENMRDNKHNILRPLQECPGYVCKGTKRCIPRSRQCDKIIDCLLGDDEGHCDHQRVDLDNQARNNENSTTKSNFFNEIMEYILPQYGSSIIDTYLGGNLKNTTKIIEKIKRSNKNVEYPRRNYFMCQKMLQIVELENVCDRHVDCQDGTDEYNCTDMDHLVDEDRLSLCDGIVDTMDAADEDCDQCPTEDYSCTESKSCIKKAQVCDGILNCELLEDEAYCLALTNDKNVTLDIDGRPIFNAEGKLHRRVGSRWDEWCLRSSRQNESAILADTTCAYLGFASYESYKITTYPQPIDKCIGTIHINCTKIPIRSLFSRQPLDDIRVVYNFPWLAVIYVDGELKCMGTLLNEDWIITSKACSSEILQLEKYYVVAAVGKGKLSIRFKQPHEALHRIRESIVVKNTDILLLRLEHPVNFTRYVQALDLSLTPRRDSLQPESCYAAGETIDGDVRFVELQSKIDECPVGKRCFEGTAINHCESKSNLSGTIMCNSRNGFYIAAVFHEPKGYCGFTKRNVYDSVLFYKDLITATFKQPSSDSYTLASQLNRCSLGNQVNINDFCDGISHCYDGEDESVDICSKVEQNCFLFNDCPCTHAEFRCPNTTICQPKSNYCDRVQDCPGGEDEPGICSCRNYLALVAPSQLCDGEIHCLDRSDEDLDECGCKQDYYHCEKSEKCVPQAMMCDGHKDCPEGDDELICYKLQPTNNKSSTALLNSGEVFTRTAGVWHPGCFSEKISKYKLGTICEKVGFKDVFAAQLKPPAHQSNNTIVSKAIIDRFSIIWLRRAETGNKLKLMYRTGNKKYVNFINDSECHRLDIACIQFPKTDILVDLLGEKTLS